MWWYPWRGKLSSSCPRTWPYLLPPPWELAERSAPVNFLFLFFVSFLLTFFPSGIKGWMGTMVTGWCGQSALGPVWHRAGDSRATRLRRRPRIKHPIARAHIRPGSAGKRSPRASIQQPAASIQQPAASLRRPRAAGEPAGCRLSPGPRLQLARSSAGCAGFRRLALPVTLAGISPPPPAQPEPWPFVTAQLLHRRRAVAQPLGN